MNDCNWRPVIKVKVTCQACGETRKCIRGDLYLGWEFIICLTCTANLGSAALLMNTTNE